MPWKLIRATQFESGGRQRDRRNHRLFCPQNPVYLPNNALARSRQHRHPAKEEDSALSPKARRQKLGNINSCKGAKGVGVKNHARRGRLKKSTELQWISLAFLQQLFLSYPGCLRPFKSVFKIPFREILYTDPRIAKR